ncbi:Phytochrome-like protein cph2 [Pelotomaculum schinkii]|uniref:Phytochrome-like protein cph2 n=1 Tax=Pelotomaculum schinkii TaxID=78350 RepID=A0A4Y7RCX1_9FIRM|nr:GGDEF domain-containing protein [Pelotomaculum schinkii]TEB06676.1 Phytochrome-like protein cph2 [Pelotomaculum schinkii]
MIPNQFRIQLQNRFGNWFPVVPEADKNILESILTYCNIQRLRIISWLLILINLTLIFIQLAYIGKIDQPRILEIAPYIMTLRMVLLVSSVAFLFVTRLPFPDAIKRFHHFYESGYIILNLITYAILYSLIHSVGPGIASSYLMAVLVSATFLYLKWSKSILIYGFSWIVFSVMVWRFQPDWILAFSAIINGSVVTILALVMSQIIYVNRVKEFLNLQTIELQKEELAASNDLLEKLSYLDALTNIPNRRFLDEFLHREWRLAVREHGLQLSLIMVDIDQFKQLNDTFGHQNGDDILVNIATTLSRTVKRPGDLFARYGGEEFAAILPKTDLIGARRIAEQMLQAVERLDINHPFSSNGRLTISIGLACIKPNDKELPETLIEAADKALYQAKKAGGNRVCCG